MWKIVIFWNSSAELAGIWAFFHSCLYGTTSSRRFRARGWDKVHMELEDREVRLRGVAIGIPFLAVSSSIVCLFEPSPRIIFLWLKVLAVGRSQLFVETSLLRCLLAACRSLKVLALLCYYRLSKDNPRCGTQIYALDSYRLWDLRAI